MPGTRETLLRHPDHAAVLASVLLLDLKLLLASFEQLGDELPIGFAMILVSELQKSEFADFLLGVTQHVLIGGVGGTENGRACP